MKTILLTIAYLSFFGILRFASLIGLARLFDYQNYDKNYIIDSSWLNGIGTLTETKIGKAGSSRFEYSYKGKLVNAKSRFLMASDT